MNMNMLEDACRNEKTENEAFYRTERKQSNVAIFGLVGLLMNVKMLDACRKPEKEEYYRTESCNRLNVVYNVVL